jgi:ribosomal protein S18 acetylase RimI-like enzyme
MMVFDIPGYQLRSGSGLDRALLVKFLQRTYQEVYQNRDFAHLALTVEQYFSSKCPVWWVEATVSAQSQPTVMTPFTQTSQPIGCLWLGRSIDQVSGQDHTHILLLYVAPEHRHHGIGTALLKFVEHCARQLGDRQISLQVFQDNQSALSLYQTFGYQVRSLLMTKDLT